MAFYNESNRSGFVTSFNPVPRYEFGNFAMGYKFAANLIAEKLIKSGNRFPDYNAYPVVFLYRHALELHLKNIIYKGARLLMFKRVEDIDNKLYNNHDLIMLSKKAHEVLITAFSEDKDLLDLSEKTMRFAVEFTAIDNNSFSYRYPIDKNGEYSTVKGQLVSLQSLAIHMDDLLSALETIDFGFGIETDLAQEAYEIAEQIFGEFSAM